MVEITDHIDRIDTNLSFESFYNDYLIKNRPCLLSADTTRDWKSRRLWRCVDDKPNFKYLTNEFGSCSVPVADCKIKYYDSQLKQDMDLGEYIDYWQKYIAQIYPQEMDCLYLKDWHFVREFPEYRAYETSVYFSSDWLNEFWHKRRNYFNETDSACGSDDYKFVYMGPKGSWTPFHADVFRSFSWSTNVCGRKRWLLFPPGEEQKLMKNGILPYDVTICNNTSNFIDVIQESGETIFVPSNWFHQVYNLEDTISINHNWLNAANIDRVFDYMLTSFEQVKTEIEDCKDMEGWNQQCQLILRSTYGMDFAEFFHLLHCIATLRMDADNVTQPAWLLKYDLSRILKTTLRLVAVKEWKEVEESGKLICNPEDFCTEIKCYIDRINVHKI